MECSACLFRLSHKSQAEATAKALGHSVLVADPRVTNQEAAATSGLGWRLFSPSRAASAGTAPSPSLAGT
jgi:hypothetical protein